MIKVWPYNPDAVASTKAGNEGITEKQISYIGYLSQRRNDGDGFLATILDSIPDFVSIESMSKGQAMYVIKCLNGEIKIVTITEDILRRIEEHVITHPESS